jgi:hypothetical protein
MNVQTTETPKGWRVSTAGRSLDILSKQWIGRPADERFVSLDDLVADRKARAERSTEVKLGNKQLRVVSPEILASDSRDVALSKMNQLRFKLEDDREIAPTNWAFGQVAGLAGAPATYLSRLPGAIASPALEYGLHYNRGRDEIKLYCDDLEALAVTGPDYGRIFDWELAEAISAATSGASGDDRWKVPGRLDWSTSRYDPLAPVTKDTTTLFGNDRGVFIFLCQDLAPIEIGKLKNGEPDLVFRGFYSTNSEVGAGKLRLGAMYLRGICDNRILWGVEAFEEVEMRHTKYAPARFVEEAMPALRSFAAGSTMKLIDGVKTAQAAIVANDKAEAIKFLADRGLAAKRAKAVYDAIVREEWGQEENDARPVDAWTMAQGITAAARSEPNFDTRMDLEKFAGGLLDKVAA